MLIVMTYRAAYLLLLFGLSGTQTFRKTPAISGSSANTGIVGTPVTVSDSDFGSSQGSGTGRE